MVRRFEGIEMFTRERFKRIMWESKRDIYRRE